MELVKVKIKDIVPYEKNAKLHPQEQIEQIKQSIEENGHNVHYGYGCALCRSRDISHPQIFLSD